MADTTVKVNLLGLMVIFMTVSGDLTRELDKDFSSSRMETGMRVNLMKASIMAKESSLQAMEIVTKVIGGMI